MTVRLELDPGDWTAGLRVAREHGLTDVQLQVLPIRLRLTFGRDQRLLRVAPRRWERPAGRPPIQ